MASAERLVQTWMASGRDEEIAEIISEVSYERLTLLDVVKALGDYLTSEEDELRSKGVELLSEILSRSPAEKLNHQSVRVLTTFYCGKLDDTETIIPALKGLNTLTALPSCSPDNATAIIQAVFKHVRMKALVHSVRFQVFSIIDNLVARNRDALKQLGAMFITGYVSLAEGEKDPRNLLVAFAIARVILIEFNISEHVESLFNITYCYFPITFRPPPNDPYGITTEDLRKSLRGCLSASPLFGPLAIPVFLEKLTAGSPATKRDTLQTMSTCFPVYGSTLARVSARKLWNSLKLEIFQPTDPLTEEEALKTTQALVETIYRYEEDAIESDDDVQGLARDVCEECIRILREPEKNQAKPAIKVLCAFMATTPSVSRYTLSQAVPHLVKLFLSPDEITNRPPILILLADLVSAARDSMPREVTDETLVPMMPYKDEVLGVVSVGLKTAISRIQAIALLRGLVTTKNLLSDQELGFVVHSVNEIFQDEGAENDDFSDSAMLEVLTTISQAAPQHIEEQTLPLLFSVLPDQPPSRNAAAERLESWRILLALKTLCVHPQLFEILVIRLTTKVDLICLPSAKDIAMEDTEPAAAYAHALLKTIADTLAVKVDAGHPDVAKYIDRLVPSLYNLFIFSALQGEWAIATDHRLVRTAGDIITLVTQCVPAQRQAKYVTAVFEVFSSGRLEGFAEGLQKFPPDAKLLLFDVSASTAQKNLLALLTAGVITAHKEVLPSPPSLDTFLNDVLSWSILHTNHYLQRESAWHLISSVLNKHAENAPAFLEDKIDNFWPKYIINGDVTDQRRWALQAWVWISKALVVQKHSSLVRFTEKLFTVFVDDEISWDAAKTLGDIANPDQILTKRNHAVIKILHAQKFVNSILPRIIGGAQDSTKPPHEQTAYLVALTSLIKAIPKTAYAHEMTSLMPLLLRGLELPDFEIRADVIDTFLAAAEGDTSDKSLVSEHAPTLVTYMLKNSMARDMPSIRVRITALQYLNVLPKIVRYDVLHPSKPVVLRELAKVLDDPKRSVRKEAVDTRTVWFKYSG